MLKAIDVANFFIDLAKSMDDDSVTNMKLNKLLYFSQAWSLVRLNHKLFDEQIEAWQYGPVITSVYRTFTSCGKNNISDVAGDYNPKVFNAEETELLIDIAIEYGQYTAYTLINITHKSGSPWENVYQSQKNNIIKESDMKEYFSKLTPLPSFSCDVKNMDFEGYRDKDGFLVLPQEVQYG